MIETENLILRRFKKEDYEDVFEYLHEPQVHCFECLKLNTLKDAKKELKRRVKSNEINFAIVLKRENKVIGEISATDHELQERFTLGLAWMLNPKYQGHGYMFEAALGFIDYLFKETNLHRLYAYTEDYNKVSQHLLEKLGMRNEGLFKDFVSFVDDENGNPIYENTYQYAILRDEWLEKHR